MVTADGIGPLTKNFRDVANIRGRGLKFPSMLACLVACLLAGYVLKNSRNHNRPCRTNRRKGTLNHQFGAVVNPPKVLQGTMKEKNVTLADSDPPKPHSKSSVLTMS